MEKLLAIHLINVALHAIAQAHTFIALLGHLVK